MTNTRSDSLEHKSTALQKLDAICNAMITDEKWEEDEKKWDELAKKLPELQALNTETYTKTTLDYQKYCARYYYYQAILYINKGDLKNARIACGVAITAHNKFHNKSKDPKEVTESDLIFLFKLGLFQSELNTFAKDPHVVDAHDDYFATLGLFTKKYSSFLGQLGDNIVTRYKKYQPTVLTFPPLEKDKFSAEMTTIATEQMQIDLAKAAAILKATTPEQLAAANAMHEPITKRAMADLASAIDLADKAARATQQQRLFLAIIYAEDCRERCCLLRGFTDILNASILNVLLKFEESNKLTENYILEKNSIHTPLPKNCLTAILAYTAYFIRGEAFFKLNKFEAAKHAILAGLKIAKEHNKVVIPINKDNFIHMLTVSMGQLTTTETKINIPNRKISTLTHARLKTKTLQQADESPFQKFERHMRLAYEGINAGKLTEAISYLSQGVIYEGAQGGAFVYRAAIRNQLHPDAIETKDDIDIAEWCATDNCFQTTELEPARHALFLWNQRCFYLFKCDYQNSNKSFALFNAFLAKQAAKEACKDTKELDTHIQQFLAKIQNENHLSGMFYLLEIIDPLHLGKYTLEQTKTIQEGCQRLHNRDKEFFNQLKLMNQPSNENEISNKKTKKPKQRGKGTTKAAKKIITTKKEVIPSRQIAITENEAVFTHPNLEPLKVQINNLEIEDVADAKQVPRKPHNAGEIAQLAELSRRNKRQHKKTLKKEWRQEQLRNRLLTTTKEAKSSAAKDFMLTTVSPVQVSSNFVPVTKIKKESQPMDVKEWDAYVNKHHHPLLGEFTLPPFVKKIQECLTKSHPGTVFKGGKVTEFLYLKFHDKKLATPKTEIAEEFHAKLKIELQNDSKNNEILAQIARRTNSQNSTTAIVKNLHEQVINNSSADEKKQFEARSKQISINRNQKIQIAISGDYDFATGLVTGRIYNTLKQATREAGEEFKTVIRASNDNKPTEIKNFAHYKAKRSKHNHRLCRVSHPNPHLRHYNVDVMHDPHFATLTSGDPFVEAVKQGNFYATQAYVVDGKILIPDARTLQDLRDGRFRAIKKYEDEPILIFQAIDYESRYENSFIDPDDIIKIKAITASFQNKKDEQSLIMEKISAGEINSYIKEFCRRGSLAKIIKRFFELGVIYNIPLLPGFYGQQDQILQNEIILLKIIADVDNDPKHGLKKLYGYFILYEVISNNATFRKSLIIDCIRNNPLYLAVFEKVLTNPKEFDRLFEKIYENFSRLIALPKITKFELDCSARLNSQSRAVNAEPQSTLSSPSRRHF